MSSARALNRLEHLFRPCFVPSFSKTAASALGPATSNHSIGRYIHTSRVTPIKMSIVTEAPKAGSSMPEWFAPRVEQDEPVLKVYNSLTRRKDAFVPKRGKRVDWYNCGPTVYDASHMGHARNYLTQDIVRRILQDYFGYEVNFVMNVTDIDDKIILRARESYLIEQLVSSTSSLTPELISLAREAFTAYFQKRVVRTEPSPTDAPASPNADSLDHFAAVAQRDQVDASYAKAAREKEEKWSMYLASLTKASSAIRIAEKKLEGGNAGAEAVKEIVDSASDVLGPYLGETRGSTVEDPIAVSRKLAAFWEDKYFEDMARLRILPPDVVTRVSEYVPEIVSFVQQIIANGFAYEGGGSVWFDVAKFEGADGDGFRHEYAKLQPNNKGNKKLLEEGEGALTGSQGKKQPADFALWKAKRGGEPAWPSPWGEGRPGWHIECSVMASEVLGQGMDIHSGGVDLMFPHHDNELAQSEAYHGCKQWVNYFLHTGHLHIEGLKMSKSLKNFITIDDALKDYSARQLRLAFMLQTWNSKMDFKRDLIADVKAKEETIDKFFANVKARISEANAKKAAFDGNHHFDQPEKALLDELHKAQDDFRAALCDSFNTPAAVLILMELIGKVNVYFSSRGREVNVEPVRVIAEWVTRMLRMFGLGEGPYADGQIGWGKEGGEASSGDFETKVDKYIRAMSSFRDEIRKLAIAGGSSKDILALCDRFRDQDLVNLGVQLDDGAGADGGALYKLVDPEVLIRQREEKAQLAAEKAAKKAASAQAAEAKRIAQLEKGRVPPLEMFKPPHVPQGLYTQWDEAGVPTHDGDGNEVSKSLAKKLAKESKAQEKSHEAFLAWQREQAQQ